MEIWWKQHLLFGVVSMFEIDLIVWKYRYITIINICIIVWNRLNSMEINISHIIYRNIT